jgi:TPR repeat protein
MYRKGEGSPRNPTLGCDWYEKAANAGYVRAQNNLSLCYHKGDGRPKDIEQAIFWAEKAAKQEDTGAQITLIKIYAPVDREKALYWGQKTADRNSVIGRLVMDGLGIPYTGPKPSRLESYCFLVMIDFFGKQDDYCDGINLTSLLLDQ